MGAGVRGAIGAGRVTGCWACVGCGARGAGFTGAADGLNSSEIFGMSLPELPMPNLSRQRALPGLFEVS